MIQFDHVSYRYPGREQLALDDVSLVIDSGEFVLVGGMSGSGKSTALRAINGLVPNLSGGEFGGVVRVDEVDTRRNGPRMLSRTCGFVFQDPDAQAVADTVVEEIAFSLEQFGVPVPTMRVRVEEMLNLLGIAHLRNRHVATLSGGERQRVAIAGALALHPECLILDEPTSQLDPWGADDLVDALVRLNHHLGITIVVAEHRLERFLPVADRVIWMDGGRIVGNGPINETIRVLPEHALPPVIALARRLEMWPAPLTMKDARKSINWKPQAMPARVAPATGRAVVRMHDVMIDRDKRRVLSAISLEARQGEVVSLVGPNGSGKSTLLRSIFGFEKPNQGEVHVLGHDMIKTSAQTIGTRAAYLPQRSGSVLFNETVRAELDFTIKHRRTDAGVERLIEQLELAELMDHDPRDLSEGQRLRAALGAILVGQPELVVLDEPTRGLDGAMRMHLISLIRTLRNQGACVVMATHDTELAAEISDRIVLLGNGAVIADDTPEAVLGPSLAYSTQMSRLLGPPYLTLADTGLITHVHLPDTYVPLSR